jgi:glycosyltransferase involved in cell wall biosynthesis
MASDDNEHWEHVTRLGKYWDAIICVSDYLAHKVKEKQPDIAPRTYGIANGVTPMEGFQAKSFAPGRPLRMIYSGRIDSKQKRIPDLLAVARGLDKQGLSFHLTLAGGGEETPGMMESARDLIDRNLVNFVGILDHEALLKQYESHHLFLLGSGYEGMSNSMLEAMSRGCVPVTTRVESGALQIIRDGENGLLAPVGDIASFVKQIVTLHKNPTLLNRMSQASYDTIHEGEFTTETMVNKYIEVFDLMKDQVEAGRYIRPGGPILPPKNFNRLRLAIFFKPMFEFVSPITRRLRNAGILPS